MKLIVQSPFSWAHRGVEIENFAQGQEIETEDHDLIDVAKNEGWVAEPGAQAPAKPVRTKK
ncbi:hypothetical protein [Massilia sp. X63]|uniref:hypothetical protein n=1 Tax=Massilia sp. X63 TaxID=3237285 RepID=UPI0034DD2C8B